MRRRWMVALAALLGLRAVTLGVREQKEGIVTIERTVLLLALVMAPALASCTAIRASAALYTEQWLVHAGFRTMPADSPVKLADLKTMPALKVVARLKDGDRVYTYADPYACRCLYVGGPAEYSEYERHAGQGGIVREQPDTLMDWELWGP